MCLYYEDRKLRFGCSKARVVLLASQRVDVDCRCVGFRVDVSSLHHRKRAKQKIHRKIHIITSTLKLHRVHIAELHTRNTRNNGVKPMA